jgi:hypothetical protein
MPRKTFRKGSKIKRGQEKLYKQLKIENVDLISKDMGLRDALSVVEKSDTPEIDIDEIRTMIQIVRENPVNKNSLDSELKRVTKDIEKQKETLSKIADTLGRQDSDISAELDLLEYEDLSEPLSSIKRNNSQIKRNRKMIYDKIKKKFNEIISLMSSGKNVKSPSQKSHLIKRINLRKKFIHEWLLILGHKEENIDINNMIRTILINRKILSAPTPSKKFGAKTKKKKNKKNKKK